MRRDERIEITPGPGQYKLQEADRTVKNRNPAWDWQKSAGRTEQYIDQNGGPGAIEENRNFGSNLKSMTIGTRRDSKIP